MSNSKVIGSLPEGGTPSSPLAGRGLGVLGGMGPLATVDFMRKIILHTAAKRDQDHVKLLVVSDPTVPDRTEAIVSGATDPLPVLLDGARLLAEAGVKFAAIPCNTAHYWFDQIAAAVPLEWVHIADAVADELPDPRTSDRRVALLATSGTISADIYPSRLATQGIEWLLPSSDEQHDLVDASMRAVKAGNHRDGVEMLIEVERRLYRRGARSVILACTEFPVALAGTAAPPGLRRIDATDALARLCVAKVKAVDLEVHTHTGDSHIECACRPQSTQSRPR